MTTPTTDAERWDTQDLVKEIALQGYDFVPPSTVANIYKITLNEAFRLLLETVKSGETTLDFVVVCNNPECNGIVPHKKHFTSPENQYKCPACGHQGSSRYNQLTPVFRLTEEYQAHIDSLISSPVAEEPA